MIRDSFYRVFKRKRIIIIALIILLINVIDVVSRASGKVFTDKLVVQSAFLETMIANGSTNASNVLYTYLAFILAAMPMSDSLIEDKETGINKIYLLKISKKEYLIKRFLINFFYGGFFVAIVILLNLLIWLCIRPSLALTYYNTGLINEIFLVDLLVKNPIMFYLVTIFRIFLVAGVISSFAMLLNDIFNSKYIGLGGVFVIDLIITLIIDWIRVKYGIFNSFASMLQLVDGFVLNINIYSFIYPILVLIGSFLVLMITNKNRQIIWELLEEIGW